MLGFLWVVLFVFAPARGGGRKPEGLLGFRVQMVLEKVVWLS